MARKEIIGTHMAVRTFTLPFPLPNEHELDHFFFHQFLMHDFKALFKVIWT